MLRRNGKAYSYFNEFKTWCFGIIGNSCVLCGSMESLEIDHIDRKEKSFNVTSLWTIKSQSEMEVELAKCQPLCSDCHKVKTAKEFSIDRTKPPNHGSIYAWMKKKCKCDVCKIARKKWNIVRNDKRRVKGGRGAYDMSKSHGYSMYKKGCRCDICTTSNTNKCREYRDKKKSNNIDI